ncbi:MAG: hypothetical protein QM611_01950 [Microbacterium sp.]|uniref:hypothetical protein n=1 Tax=Microbacterium sp. TaxID=51671 RepID=UPI0039E338F5
MNKTLAASAAAAAFALVGALLSPAATAAPVAHAAALTAVPTTVTAKVDVDGDGRKDRVKVAKTGSSKYKVTVKTAKGRTASKTITSTAAANWGMHPFWGSARLDKRKGSELLLATGGGDGLSSVVLTWRNNKLVRQAAPRHRSYSAAYKYRWYTAGMTWANAGYRFYTKNGKRYVQNYWIEQVTGSTKWRADIVTSKWTKKGWTRVSSKKVRLTATQAKKYPGGFTGVKIVSP